MEALDTTLYEEGTQVPLNPHTTSSQVSHKDTTVKKALEETVNFTPQELTPEQQTQARENINALEDEVGVIDEEHIATGAVTTDKIADEAITEDKLASQSISSKKIKDATIGASKLGVNSVTTAKIKDGAVTEEKLADGAVTEGKLADGAVTEEKLADGAVTKEKLADGVLGEGPELIDMSQYASTIKTLIPDDVALKIFEDLSGQGRAINWNLFISGPGNWGVNISGPLFCVGEILPSDGYEANEVAIFGFSGLVYSYGEGTTPVKIYQMHFYFESGHYYCRIFSQQGYGWDLPILISKFVHSPVCYNEDFGAGYSSPIIIRAGVYAWTRTLFGKSDSWYAVPRLTSTQVNALVEKLKTQFPDVGEKELRGAFALCSYTQKTKGFILDDDISNIGAVIYGIGLYFFKE